MIVNIEPGKRLTEEQLEYVSKAVNDEDVPVVYLGIDPGKANGVCGYGDNYELLFALTITADDINLFLHQFKKINTCIIESFNLYPNKASQQHYSNMETSRVIGRVESWAEIYKVKLIKQSATVKKTGYLWTGLKPLPKSNKRNHLLDAHIHFMYWAIKTGHISASDILNLRGFA